MAAMAYNLRKYIKYNNPIRGTILLKKAVNAADSYLLACLDCMSFKIAPVKTIK
jgi:hypothetical protein